MIAVGVAGLAFIARLRTGLLPQPFTAFTVTLPLTKLGAKSTVIAVLPCPNTMVPPVDTVHI